MEIKAFKAFRYDRDAVGDVGGCIAPPYDVIDNEHRQRLYQKSPYNIVRIIKGKTTDSDTDSSNQYTRSADFLNTWISKGILKQDSVETIYAYVQNFQALGKQFQRSSFISLAKLEQFGPIVRPHEQILSAPKIDRLNLTRATAAQFGLIFVLYQDRQRIADNIIDSAAKQQPLIDFIDCRQVRHRLFAITSTGDIDAIAEMMTDKSCIIADGHHRYETALAYHKESGNPAAGYQMLAFTNARNEGLIILATHRVVKGLEDLSFEQLIEGLKGKFELTEYKFEDSDGKEEAKRKMLDQMKAEMELGKNAFGIYGGAGSFYAAVLKDKKAMKIAASNMSDAWRSLDVSVLGKLILEELLALDDEKVAKGIYLEYVKDTPTAIDDSIAGIDNKEKQVAFFTNPPTMTQLKAVTDAGERMPQKSTYFYPKIYTGLTINKL